MITITNNDELSARVTVESKSAYLDGFAVASSDPLFPRLSNLLDADAACGSEGEICYDAHDVALSSL